MRLVLWTVGLQVKLCDGHSNIPYHYLHLPMYSEYPCLANFFSRLFRTGIVKLDPKTVIDKP